MSSLRPSHEIEEKLRAVTRTPAPDPAFVASLRARLDARPPRRLSGWEKLRLTFRQPLWASLAAALVLLALVFLALGPQKVLAAARGLLGYVPGIGLVQDDVSLRVLSAPAQVERSGITLKVNEGAADSQRTVLIFQVDGLSVKAANSQGEGAQTGSVVQIRLPDGTLLQANGGDGTGWGTGYQFRAVFQAIPAGVMEVTLVIPRLQDMPAGAAPEDWQVALHFQPAPADLKVMPVYELAAPQPTQAAAMPATPAPLHSTPDRSESPTAPAATAPASGKAPGTAGFSNVSTQDGIQVSLEKVVELEDGYLLQGSTSWKGLQGVSLVSFNPLGTLLDASGQPIPVEPANLDPDLNQDTNQHDRWGIRTNSKAYPGPWNLTIPAMDVDAQVDVPFQIDLGAAPQVGQTQTINQDLTVAGYQVTLKTAGLSKDLVGDIWLDLTFDGGPGVNSVSPFDHDNQSQMLSSRGGGEGGKIVWSMKYDQMPTGVHHLSITGISYRVEGPWQMSWNPPVMNGQPLPTPTIQPQVCLTSETLAQVMGQAPSALPGEIMGRMLLEVNTGQLMPQIVLANPDGSQQKKIAIGAWSALSPDGTTVAFIKSNGPSLFLADTQTGTIRPLAGSTKDDYNPVMSPDGKWIAFVRANEGVFIIHPDGTGLKQVMDASRIAAPAGWLPDSQGLVVTAIGPGGSQVQKVDIQTGKVEDQFIIANVKGGFARLSPDGKWLAFNEMVFGQANYGVYISHLDGSEKRLIAGLGESGAAAGAWSADSQWLIVNVSTFTLDTWTETPVLIRPGTCQVVRLDKLAGQVTDWR